MKSTTKRAKHFQLNKSLSLKIISLLTVCALLVCGFSGCDNTTVATEADTYVDKTAQVQTSTVTLRLGYSADDSLNPYFMSTDLNSDLISLVFEPLYYIDDSFSADNGLALSSSLSGNTLTVKLDTSAAFSDGVQFSSTDVVYSFNLAKSSSAYKNNLKYVQSASASGSDTVIFSLSGYYRSAEESLNFPIVKNATADNSAGTPIGTGLYAINADGDSVTLSYNPYCRKPQPNISKIELHPLDSASTLVHTLELGSIDAYFDDLSAGNYSQANAQTTKTNMTNLVFLGMNSASYGLSSSAVRKAIYHSVNRQSIVTNAFKNYAVESYTPYHPEWHIYAAADYDSSALALDYSKAQTLLKNEGYNDNINYTLIVYSGNNFKTAAAKEIQASLANVGITVTISELTWENYKAALVNGAYDLYIGEIKLPANMDMSALFTDSKAVYGVSAADTTNTAYSEFAAGNISINALTDSFLQNMPFVPICFRAGVLIYSNEITPAADCDFGNVYKNIFEWNNQ
ncbi:MAG: ABC transporter substrate-binding protein [Clostridia bacterium]|nr:ABC transporter substrate-binding protein [Clostridia bacterium]